MVRSLTEITALQYAVVGMAAPTAIGVYVQYWWPDIPTWVSALAFFVLVNGINLLHVKLFGEMEFWFSIIKIAAIISMIAFGGYLLASDTAGPQASIANLWQLDGFFPHGVEGMVMAMAVIMFSFGGLELVGITAAEAKEPGKTIPRATNQILYRIMIFYVGALAVLMSLYPWNEIQQGSSPFVMIFRALDSQGVAAVLNVVVLTAALSVYNSCVYCNSRMLLGLSLQGNAPKALGRVNRRGVPVNALAASAAATAICVLINYLLPGEALELLMMLVVAALVINWMLISITHLKFRHAMQRQNAQTAFKSWGAPMTNYLCMAFMLGILTVMMLTPGMSAAVWLVPVWLAFMAASYSLLSRKAVTSADPLATVS